LETPETGILGIPAISAEGPVAELAERAAIIADGAAVPADWAQGFARPDTVPAPGGVQPTQWREVVDAAGRFLDQWGGKAAALGWTAGELFGLDLATQRSPSMALKAATRLGPAPSITRRMGANSVSAAIASVDFPNPRSRISRQAATRTCSDSALVESLTSS
jgi:hypothetical protein